MAERFFELHEKCRNNPNYLGNTLENFYMFYYSSMNEQYSKRLNSLLVSTIHNSGGLLDDSIRFGHYKNCHDIISDSNEYIKFYKDFVSEDINEVFKCIKTESNFIGNSIFSFYLFNYASLDQLTFVRLVDLIREALEVVLIRMITSLDISDMLLMSS